MSEPLISLLMAQPHASNARIRRLWTACCMLLLSCCGMWIDVAHSHHERAPGKVKGCQKALAEAPCGGTALGALSTGRASNAHHLCGIRCLVHLGSSALCCVPVTCRVWIRR